MLQTCKELHVEKAWRTILELRLVKEITSKLSWNFRLNLKHKGGHTRYWDSGLLQTVLYLYTVFLLMSAHFNK